MAATENPSKPKQKVVSKPNKKALLSKQTKLDAAMAIAQRELTEVNRQLADPATYTNRSRVEVEKLNATHSSLEKKVTELEEAWLELEMAMEEAS